MQSKREVKISPSLKIAMQSKNSAPTSLKFLSGGTQLLVKSVVAMSLTFGGGVYAQPYVTVTAGGEVSPGVYGQISVGSNPPHPVYIAPVYIPVHVHDRWYSKRHCHKHGECGRPIRFVQVEESSQWWDRQHESERDYDYRREERRNHAHHKQRRHRDD